MSARKYIKPIARLTVFVAVCCAILLYIDYRVARASVMEKLLGIGQRMAPFMDNAGEVEPVHDRTLENLHRQQLVEVRGQSDVLVLGLPYLGPYNVNSILNPILVHCLGLGYLFNMYRNKPVVRPGGAMIMFHPTPNEFHQVHHPSYVDFFEEVLAETNDPSTIESKYEERYAHDPWYIHLYRKSNAYHGVHPFYMWYWGAHGLDYLGDVIVVGGDPKTCERLGFTGGTLGCTDKCVLSTETCDATFFVPGGGPRGPECQAAWRIRNAAQRPGGNGKAKEGPLPEG